MNVNLAELYQAANIPVGAEDFVLRQAAFDAVGKELSEKQLIDCCRIYFGWWDKISEFDWILTAFQNDPRISFAGNRREFSVLAGALLLNRLRDGDAFAGLVVLCASLQDKRRPVVAGIAFSVFHKEFKNLAVEGSKVSWYDTNFKALAKTTITTETMLRDNTVPTMATAVAAALNDTHTASQAAFVELQAIVSEIAEDLSAAREQLAMLWWLTGGWSRKLKRGFVEIGSPLAYIAAGLDLADLSHTIHGPYASEALLARILSAVKRPKKQTPLSELGDAPSATDFALLELSELVNTYPEICPLSAALLKAADIGKGSAWHAAFEKVAHLPVSTALQLYETANQTMYERLLLRSL